MKWPIQESKHSYIRKRNHHLSQHIGSFENLETDPFLVIFQQLFLTSSVITIVLSNTGRPRPTITGRQIFERDIAAKKVNLLFLGISINPRSKILDGEWVS